MVILKYFGGRHCNTFISNSWVSSLDYTLYMILGESLLAIAFHVLFLHLWGCVSSVFPTALYEAGTGKCDFFCRYCIWRLFCVCQILKSMIVFIFNQRHFKSLDHVLLAVRPLKNLTRFFLGKLSFLFYVFLLSPDNCFST